MAKKQTFDKDLVNAMRDKITVDDDGKLAVGQDVFFADMADDDIKAYKDGIDLTSKVDKDRMPALSMAMGVQLINHLAAREPDDETNPQKELVAKLYGGRQIRVGVEADTGEDGQTTYTSTIGVDQAKPLAKSLTAAMEAINAWDE